MRQLQSVLAAFAAALLLGGLLSAAPVEAAAPAEQRPAAHKRYANKAFAATNNRREAHERRALRRNDCVQKWARRQARKMARQERMFHQDLQPVLRNCGLSTVGENVAYGYPTGRAVVRGWMNSPGHRENILRREFRLMGIAARKGGSGRWYAAQVFAAK